MSGIAAVVNFDGSPVGRAEIERMANVLKPYGQDKQKTLLGRNVGFAFCLQRLTTEDLFDRQPLVLADRFVLLFDGRLDNRDELCAALGLASHEAEFMSDSAIAFHLYERWAERSFELIQGVFAIIVMDLETGKLVCSRDHMGLRVLHYYHSPARFAVATVPEALFALSWVPRILNQDKVGDALVQRGLNGETTYYRNINRVMPGSMVRVKNAGLTKNRFWQLDGHAEIRFKNDDEYVEAFNELLIDAVRANLRACRAPCASITGGLDSSSIAVTAAKMLAASETTLHTFTAVPERGFIKKEIRGRYFDETPYVRQIAEMYPNIEPHFVHPREGSLVEQIHEQIRIAGAPAGGVLNGLWTMDILAAARARGHNVMLSGEMGDHTMSYNGWTSLPSLALSGRWLRLMREIIASEYRWKYFARQTMAAFIPARLFRYYKYRRRHGRPPWYNFSTIHPDFAENRGVIERAAREFLPFDAPPPINGRMHRIRTLNSYSETADWFARVRAAFGIDIRTPAFDRRLVEFCIGVPAGQYLRDGRDRWLIRRAMKGLLPEVVLNNKSTGVQAADWFQKLTHARNDIAAELGRLGQDRNISSIVDLNRLREIVEVWPTTEPPEYGEGALPLFWALPQALGAARFIENVNGANRSQ